MTVTVNGEEREVKATTLAELLEELLLDTRRCATMVNGTIVRKERRADHRLRENDQVDIISMVGGG